MNPWKGRRIVLLCEGDTEELAVKHFVTRQWQGDGLGSIGLHSVNLSGKLQDAPVKTHLYLDETDVLAVFALIDLHGMDRVEHHPEDPLKTKVERVQDWFRSIVAKMSFTLMCACTRRRLGFLLREVR